MNLNPHCLLPSFEHARCISSKRLSDALNKAGIVQDSRQNEFILPSSGKLEINSPVPQLYSQAVYDAHHSGALHIHELATFSGHCASWSLRHLLHDGLNKTQHKEAPPLGEHLSRALEQISHFITAMQNEWTGAQTICAFDTSLAPLIRLDQLEYGQVKQSIQTFIKQLNLAEHTGAITPISHLTFDWICPENLREQIPSISGKKMPFCYGDLHAEMRMINRAYLEIIMEGDGKGRAFTLPISSYNIRHHFPWEDPNTDLLFEMTAQYGLPYFQNFLHPDPGAYTANSATRASQQNPSTEHKEGGCLFAATEQTTALGIVTLNCARIGYEFKGDEAAAFARVDTLLALAKHALEIKRQIIECLITEGVYSYTQYYLDSLCPRTSSICISSVNEMIRNFSDDAYDLSDPRGHAFATRLLDHIRVKISEFHTETGHAYHLSAIYDEAINHRFAREDKQRYPAIVQAGTQDAPYYTHASQFAVGFSDDPFEVLSKQEALQRKYNGGTVQHLYMSEASMSAKACKLLIQRSLSRFQLPSIAISPAFSICPKHGYLAGHHEFCPKCDDDLIAKIQAQAKPA